MKALTLTQPWASLVAIGAKKIETRSWATSYRGKLAIHAAVGLGPVGGVRGLTALCRSEPFRSLLLAAGLRHTSRLPRGAIVAVCDLVDCISTDLLVLGGGANHLEFADTRMTDGQGNVYRRHYVAADHGRKWPLTDQEHSFGDYSPGRVGWLLANVRPLPVPIPAKGALGLWTPSADALAQIEAALEQ